MKLKKLPKPNVRLKRRSFARRRPRGRKNKSSNRKIKRFFWPSRGNLRSVVRGSRRTRQQ